MRMCEGSFGHQIGGVELPVMAVTTRTSTSRPVTTGTVSAPVLAGEEKDAVVRLLPGELLQVLSRELNVEASRLAA